MWPRTLGSAEIQCVKSRGGWTETVFLSSRTGGKCEGLFSVVGQGWGPHGNPSPVSCRQCGALGSRGRHGTRFGESWDQDSAEALRIWKGSQQARTRESRECGNASWGLPRTPLSLLVCPWPHSCSTPQCVKYHL